VLMWLQQRPGTEVSYKDIADGVGSRARRSHGAGLFTRWGAAPLLPTITAPPPAAHGVLAASASGRPH
jgi:hypothetical protein